MFPQLTKEQQGKVVEAVTTCCAPLTSVNSSTGKN
jgi:hypothetical protein